jgi:hypothetical protein
MVIINRHKDHKICQHHPLPDPPKFTQTEIFGLKNTQSGNPAPNI